MKKRKIVYGTIVLSLALLAGCGLDIKVPGNSLIFNKETCEPEPEVIESVEPIIEKELSIEELLEAAKEGGDFAKEEIRMLELELMRNQEGLSREEYEELANIYVELGHMLDARNIVEEAYKLSISDSYIEKLNEIFVDVDEETNDVKDIFKTLGQFLKEGIKDGDFSKVIRLLESDEWNKLIMPFVRAGYRNYYVKDEGTINLVVKDGYSEAGKVMKRLYFVDNTNPESKGIVLEQNGEITTLYIEEAKEKLTINSLLSGESDKSFTRYIIDSVAGTIELEKGSLNKGLFVGDYSYSIVQKEEHCAYDLFQCRNDEPKETYLGLFDENGKTKVSEPQASSISSFAKAAGTETAVVYAYNSKKDKCLYKGVSLEEVTKGVIFDTASLSLENTPEIKEYNVKNKVTLADIRKDKNDSESNTISTKVRIYNGQIQVFDGETWKDYGAYETYLENDPFKASEELVKLNMEEHKSQDTNQIANSISAVAGSIVIPKQQVQVAGVNRPASNSNNSKPASSQTQTPQAAPQPAPAPEPAPAPTPVVTPTPAPENPTPNDNSGGSGQSSGGNEGDSGGSSGGNSGGDSGGSSDSGKDTDIDYSDLFK